MEKTLYALQKGRVHTMIQLIGFNIIFFAITSCITFIFGYDLTLKDKIMMITAEVILLAMISVGVVMLAGFN